MPTVHGYLMFGRGDPDQVLADCRQRYAEAAAEYDGYKVAPLVVEDTSMAKQPLRSRNLGLKLSNTVTGGDVVVFPVAYRAFKGVADLSQTIDTWAARDVDVVVLDLGLDTAEDYTAGKLAIMRAAVEFQSKSRGVTVKRRIASGRAKGKFHGKPPFGLRVVGPKDDRRYEIIPEDFAVGKIIVSWHLAGHTFEAIRKHLRSSGVFKKAMPSDPIEWKATGRPYSQKMVRVAYDGTLRLMNWIKKGKVKDTTEGTGDGGQEAAGDGVPGEPGR